MFFINQFFVIVFYSISSNGLDQIIKKTKITVLVLDTGTPPLRQFLLDGFLIKTVFLKLKNRPIF